MRLTVFAQQPQNLGGPNTSVLVKGALVLGDTVTFAPTGSISVKNGVLYVKAAKWRRSSDSVVDITTLGAIGDGVTDNTTAFNTAASLGRSIKIPAGTFKINGRVNINKSGTSFIGDNKGTTKIISSTAPILFHIFGASNVSFERMSFYNNYPTTVGFIGCIISITDSVFDAVHYTRLDSNLTVRDCYFTAPTGDGLVIVSNRGAGASGYKRGIYVIGNTFENMGSGGLTCLSSATSTGMSDIHFEGNTTRHTGLRDDSPGFAVSLSGAATNNYIIGNQLHDYKTIGFELAGPSYSLIMDNTGDSSHRNQTLPISISTCLFTMDATGSVSGVGNKAIHNTSLDNTPSFPHINNQDRVTLQDNTLISDSIPILFDSVRNINISGDRYIRMTTNSRPIFYMRNGSTNVNLSSTSFIGNSSQNQLILFQSRTAHVKFTDCPASGNAVNGTLVNTDTSCHDISGTFNSALAGGMNYDYGSPIASSPVSDIVIDADGRRKIFPYGGIRKLTNTQRNALTPSEGDYIYSLTDHTIEFYNGSVWKQITTN